MPARPSRPVLKKIDHGRLVLAEALAQEPALTEPSSISNGQRGRRCTEAWLGHRLRTTPPLLRGRFHRFHDRGRPSRDGRLPQLALPVDDDAAAVREP